MEQENDGPITAKKTDTPAPQSFSNTNYFNERLALYPNEEIHNLDDQYETASVPNNKPNPILTEDETMMMDDFALFASKKEDRIEQNQPKQDFRKKLTITSSSDQTLAQLYLALDRPESINLKYDWVSASFTENK